MITTTKDGRIIRKGADYTEFRLKLHWLQLGRCTRCGGYSEPSLPPESAFSFHVHHTNGRGMGGAKRDDTFESCEGLCGNCHRKEHNQ